MARNIEVLRNYFFGKDPQLKETMADNSLRLIGIEGKHFVLRTELIARLEELKNYVDEKDTELREAIDEVIQDLENETAARANADRILQQNIDNEKTARQTADNALSGRITTNTNDILALNNWKNNTDFVLADDLLEALSDYYDKAEVNQLISTIPRFDIEVVQTLPTQDISETTIYLVPSSSPETRNSYDEFIYVNNTWEQIGSTAIDLSDYYTKVEIDDLLEGTTIQKVTTSSARLYEMEPGIYMLPSNFTLYYNGATDVSSSQFFFYPSVLTVYGTSEHKLGISYWFDGGSPCLTGYYTLSNMGDYFYVGTFQNIQKVSNIVTSISSSSTNTQYPSALAVYNALQTKQNTLTAGDNITINNNIISALGLTYTDLTASGFPYICNRSLDHDYIYSASNSEFSGKLKDGIYKASGLRYTSGTDLILSPGASAGGEAFFLVNQESKSAFPLTYDLGNFVSGYFPAHLSDGAVYYTRIENYLNKVTSITSSSTDNQYPSAKAVYDFVGENSDMPQGSIVQYDGDTIPTGYEEANGFENYSTTEQKVGTWIDGKPLYRIVVEKKSVDKNGQFTIPELVNAEASFVEWWKIGTLNSSNNTGRTGYLKSDYHSGIQLNNGELTLFVEDGTNASIKFICSIIYTKTTDSAS